ncbi:Radical SAM superfamily protein [Candidatus Gugararchaeum adminiculabundum]|nr:Radical SAM superfamily protein [Candidatus Gugararchaeum adminiculabundum]
MIPSEPIPDQRKLMEAIGANVAYQVQGDVSVNFTKRCPLICEHCYENAGSHGAETIELDTLLNSIKGLRKLNGGKFPARYHISGGDPLQELENLLQACEEIRELTGTKHIVVRTTGLPAANNDNRELLEKLAKLPFVRILATLNGCQRDSLRKLRHVRGYGADDLDAVQRDVTAAYQLLNKLFGERRIGEDGPGETSIPDMHDFRNEFYHQWGTKTKLAMPFGRGAASSSRVYTVENHDCFCFGISYKGSPEIGEVKAVKDGPGINGTHIWIDHLGGLHLSQMMVVPIINLAADNPEETINPHAVRLAYGGVLLAAQGAGIQQKKILDYFFDGKNCNLCYKLKQQLAPAIC